MNEAVNHGLVLSSGITARRQRIAWRKAFWIGCVSVVNISRL